MPEPQPRSRIDSPSVINISSALRHIAVVGCWPVPKAMPDRCAARCHRASERFFPRRDDDKALADALDAEVLLPGLSPVGFGEFFRVVPDGRALERRVFQCDFDSTPDAVDVGVRRT